MYATNGKMHKGNHLIIFSNLSDDIVLQRNVINFNFTPVFTDFMASCCYNNNNKKTYIIILVTIS